MPSCHLASGLQAPWRHGPPSLYLMQDTRFTTKVTQTVPGQNETEPSWALVVGHLRMSLLHTCPRHWVRGWQEPGPGKLALAHFCI